MDCWQKACVRKYMCLHTSTSLGLYWDGMVGCYTHIACSAAYTVAALKGASGTTSLAAPMLLPAQPALAFT